MSRLLPKSMPGLVIAGFVVVIVPLVISIIFSMVVVDRLSDQSESLVLQGVQVTRHSKVLSDKITAMEQHARQYHVLGVETFVDLFEERKKEFIVTLDALNLVNLKGVADWNLEQMREDVLAISKALRLSSHNTPELELELSRFDRMIDLADGISSQGNQFIDNEIERLQKTSELANRFLLWSMVALFPLVLIAVVIFTFLISRPFSQIDKAIQRLGEHDYEKPIQVSANPRELASLGAQLDWLRGRLKQLEQEQTTFLSHISHELKTPLSSIREATELLLDGSIGPLSETQHEVATILKEQSIQLQKHIENLLNFTAWQNQKETLSISRFPVKPVVDSIMENHKLTCAHKGLHLKVEVEDMTVKADKSRLRIAFDNLISNAVKFSPEQGTIRFSLRKKGSGMVIDVVDSGPGIPEQDRNNVFEPFFQSSPPGSGHISGTGIGLSVVRECIREHGGDIYIVDNRDNGAHFRIEIPDVAVK